MNSVISFVVIILAVLSIRFFSSKYLFNVFSLLIAFSIVDVFFPAILWDFFGRPSVPIWQEELDYSEVTVGILFYSLFYILMCSVPFILGRKNERYIVKTTIFRNRLLLVICFLFFMAALNLLLEISSYGGFGGWLYGKGTSRWSGAIGDASAHNGAIYLILQLPWRSGFSLVVSVAFYYRYIFRHPKLYGYFFPFLGLVLSLSSFFKGTVFVYVLMLSFSEYNRLKINKIYIDRSIKKRITLFLATAVLLFFGYGSVRHYIYLSTDVGFYGTDRSTFELLGKGHGLVGVSNIVSNYSDSVPLFLGKTYFDMAMRPVPRAIYTSKPDWYGIDDITRAMGWSIHTQSAVTIPGEAFANFGYLGLFVALVFGYLLWVAQEYLYRDVVSFLMFGPLLIIQIPLIASWMSFTGVMSVFNTFIIIVLVKKYITRKF